MWLLFWLLHLGYCLFVASLAKSNDPSMLELLWIGETMCSSWALPHREVSKAPNLVFLVKQDCQIFGIERLRVRLGLRNALLVEGRNFGGRLALLCSNDIDITLQSFSHHHIDMIVRMLSLDLLVIHELFLINWACENSNSRYSVFCSTQFRVSCP